MTPARIRQSVSHHLRAWQQTRRYSQKDSAQAIGITASAYNKLWFGTGPITIDMLCRISIVTKLSVGELVTPPGEKLELSRRWKTSDLVARLDAARDIALALERQQV